MLSENLLDADDPIGAAVDAIVVDLCIVPRALRHAVESRTRRAVHAVLLHEGRTVPGWRLKSIVCSVAVGVWRDHKTGFLEREIRPICESRNVDRT